MGENKRTVADAIAGGVWGAGRLDWDPVSVQEWGGGGGGLSDMNNTTQKVNSHS